MLKGRGAARLTFASGALPGRMRPKEGVMIELTETSVTVTYSVRHKVGAQDCQGNTPFAVELKLPEPLGARMLLDGSETPPRDATTVPSNFTARASSV